VRVRDSVKLKRFVQGASPMTITCAKGSYNFVTFNGDGCVFNIKGLTNDDGSLIGDITVPVGGLSLSLSDFSQVEVKLTPVAFTMILSGV
jgi:hypothetical protein